MKLWGFFYIIYLISPLSFDTCEYYFEPCPYWEINLFCLQGGDVFAILRISNLKCNTISINYKTYKESCKNLFYLNLFKKLKN